MTVTNILNDIVAQLKTLDTATISDADLVPMIKAVQSVCAFTAALDAEIQKRALQDGRMLPGVVIKDATTHRKWHDAAVAADLAFEKFGIKAFKLESPAAIEKMGDEGKALVAVASYKPEAGKRVVY